MELTYTYNVPVYVTIDTDMPEGERIIGVAVDDAAPHDKGHIVEAMTTPLPLSVFTLVAKALDSEDWPGWEFGW